MGGGGEGVYPAMGGGGGGHGHREGEPDLPSVNADFSRDEDFLKLFMELPHNLRHGIGHLDNEVVSTSLGVNISGMIAGCTYKGGSCQDER